MIDLIVCELCGEEKIPTDTCIDCALATEKRFEDRIAELGSDYLGREAVLSQKIDSQQIEIDMLRRIKKQKKDRIAKLEECVKNIAAGDTPWMPAEDPPSTDSGKIFMKYAQQVLDESQESDSG